MATIMKLKQQLIPTQRGDCKKFSVRSILVIVVVVVLVQRVHVYVDEAYADKLNTKDEDEKDMLEMSFGSKTQSQDLVVYIYN